MAIDILQAIVKNKSIEHTVEHDMESFVWVLAYAIMRKIIKVTEAPETAKNPYRQQIVTDFHQSFGRLSVLDIASSRKSFGPFQFIVDDSEDFLPPYLSDPLSSMLLHLRGSIRARVEAPAVKKAKTVFQYDGLHAPAIPILTHAWLITYFNNAIRALENDPSLQR